MKFDAQRAYHHITQLAFPRASGTAGEFKARAYIVEQLEALGLTVVEEPFDFTRFPAEILPRLLSFVFIAGVVTACWMGTNQPIVASLSCTGMLLIVLALTRWQKSLEWLYNVGKIHTSKNVVATHASAADADFNLIFVAHYDSKSQVLPIAVRALCYCVGVAGLIGLTLMTLIQVFLKAPLPSPLIWAIGGCICFDSAICPISVLPELTRNSSASLDCSTKRA